MIVATTIKSVTKNVVIPNLFPRKTEKRILQQNLVREELIQNVVPAKALAVTEIPVVFNLVSCVMKRQTARSLLIAMDFTRPVLIPIPEEITLFVTKPRKFVSAGNVVDLSV